jgi:2,4-diketo-3-deoxy-L-fuconate hydrolase
MKLVTFSHLSNKGGSHVGVLDGGQVACLSEAGVAATMIEIVQGGRAMIDRSRAALASAPRYPLAGVKLEAPIRPGKVLCSGINYRGHAEENPNAKMPTEPFFFAKLPSSVVGPDTPVVKPERTGQMDYEVEFAAVIGGELHKAGEAEVMPAIFGYTLLNDISARDVQFKDNQITIGKNFAGFAPIGPCIVTTDELTKPDNVRLKTRLNGETLQDGSTSDWLFPLPRLISFLSHYVPLEPGDIVTTGTPAGVGVFRKPQVFMKAGDVVEIEAEGIGVLRNPIVAAA